MATSILERIFEHNRWANLRLIDACAARDAALLDVKVPGTFGSVRETLQHLVAAEERYVFRVTDLRWDPVGQEWPGFDALRAVAERAGDALIEAARTLAPDATFKAEWDGKAYEVDCALVLVQAINHANEHRQQIDTTMTAQGADQVDVSGWAWGDEAGLSRTL